MRRGGAGLFAAMLALAGCKTTGTKPPDRDSPGMPAARSRDTTPPWLSAVGGPHAVPKANSWADPKNPNFNAAAEAQGVLGGRVVDPFGRGAKNVYIRVELADSSDRDKGSAPIGIMTDANGYFQAKGLKPKRAYNLSAEAKFDDKPLFAATQAPTPNPSLTLQLREDLAAPPPADPTGAPTSTFPPPADVSRPPAFPPPAAPRSPDGAWSPGGTPANRPAPHSFGSPTPPAVPPLPPPVDVSPRPATKPENFADGPKDPLRAPPASIPGALPVPKLETPPGSSPNLPDGKRSAAPVRSGANFVLRDSQGVPWEFTKHRAGELVLLDFMTTTCVPCKKAVPMSKELQAQYGASGFDVVGVVCDAVPLPQRVALADKYRRENTLNYEMFTEDLSEQGRLFARYADAGAGYPFLVLLDATGNVVWRGNPANRAALDRMIRQHLAK